EKLPADRFTSAAEFSAALSDRAFTYEGRRSSSASFSTPEPVPGQPMAVGVDRRAFSAVASVAVVALGLAAWAWLAPGPEPLPAYATRLAIDLGSIQLGLWENIVVSPDGSRFAVTGVLDEEQALYWRSAGEESFRVVPGTDGARGASFSPDGEWVVYATLSGGLYKVSLSGGAPVPLVRPGSETLGFYSPHWGDDGTIVFKNPSGSFRIRDTGGEYARVPGFEAIIHTHLLPGGQGVLGSRIPGGIVLADLEADTVRELTSVGFRPTYVETGHILYVDAAGGLWALPFEASSREVLGEAIPIFDGVSVMTSAGFSFPRYSVSRNGTLAYGSGGRASAGVQRLVTMDLEGNEEVSGLAPRSMGWLRWSPDGRSVAYGSLDADDLGSDIYTYDMASGTTPRRLTFEAENDRPVFSPDGDRVAFTSLRPGTEDRDVFMKNLTDDTPARLLAALPGDQFVTDWFAADSIAVERRPNPSDLWIVDLSDPERPSAEEYLSAEADLDALVVSSDGGLAAYVSDETGADEVYIRSFPVPGERTQVSQGGGGQPRWSPDGGTVYYWSRSGVLSSTLWAARLRRSPTAVVSREPLFETDAIRAWDLHPDGDRLVAAQEMQGVADASGRPVQERFLVVTNWFQELRERMGEN
ncbi:MAG: PD40 domain-containing protein, partial [Gemmatimonadales bacterium]